MPDKAERVLVAIELRMGTALAYYDGLQARLGEGEAISFRDLEPPSAPSLLRYLRLPAAGPFSERLAIAAVELLADHGIDEAFRRLGSLSIPLPQPMMDAFGALASREQMDAIARWDAANPTPVHRIHLARLTSQLAPGAESEALQEKQVDVLLAAVTDGGMATLAALLRAFGGRSTLWRGIASLGPAERIAACWVHACQIFRLVGPVVDAADLRNLAERHSGDSAYSIFADGIEYRSDVACPQFVAAGALLTWGLAYASAARTTDTLLEAEREALSSLVIQQVDGVPFPQRWLLEARFLRPNATASFLGDPINRLVEAATGTDVGKWYAAEAQGKLILHCLQTAGPNEPGLNAWRMLLCMVGFAAVAHDMGDALCGAVERTIDVVPEAGSSLCVEISRFAARQAACSGSPELRAAATQLFNAITPKLIELAVGEAAARRCIEQILRAAVDLSREETRIVSIEVFAGLARVVADTGPLAVRAVRTFLNQAVRHIPFQQAEVLWPLILELRSR